MPLDDIEDDYDDDGFSAGVYTLVPVALERDSTPDERDKRLEDHRWDTPNSDEEEADAAPPEPAVQQEQGVAPTPVVRKFPVAPPPPSVVDGPRKARWLR